MPIWDEFYIIDDDMDQRFRTYEDARTVAEELVKSAPGTKVVIRKCTDVTTLRSSWICQ